MRVAAERHMRADTGARAKAAGRALTQARARGTAWPKKPERNAVAAVGGHGIATSQSVAAARSPSSMKSWSLCHP